MNGYALQNKTKSLAPKLRDLIAWHEEQVAELEGILEHESECKFHEEAIKTLKKLLP